MATGFVFHPRYIEHRTGAGHPECPARLEALVRRVQHEPWWDRLRRIDASPADARWPRSVHDPAYVEHVQAACENGMQWLDGFDTGICAESYDIALLAVGGVLNAVDAVLSGADGGLGNAFCAVRPPGHHAERDQAMGFCLFNNIAIAAQYLRERHGLERVAIVDFDVHHGNGTQHLFEARRDVLFISLHEHPLSLFPGTGFAHERGTGAGAGFTVNIPMPPGAGDNEYRAAFQRQVVPELDSFQPQFLLVSAGFDAVQGDPLAHLSVSPEGFHWMTRQLLAAAQRHCGGRLVSVLEGGYDLDLLPECVVQHLTALLEGGPGA